MRGIDGIRTAALALAAAAALPALAFAGGSNSGNPQEQARIEQWIDQAIHGNSDADRQEQARIDRLVQQALRSVEAGRDGRAGIVAQGRPGAIGR